MKIIVVSVLWILFIAYRAISDSWLIKSRVTILHWENAVLSVWVAGLLLFGANSLWLLPTYLSIYWLLFDMILNKMRGLDLLYLGKTAFLDRIFHNKYIQLTVKLICLILSIAIFVVI